MNNAMNDLMDNSILSKTEIEELQHNMQKLEDIWNNRPEGLTFPQEYLDLKQNNLEMLKEVRELNDKIDSLFQKAAKNTEKAALVLKDFVKNKNAEELAQYIKPNQIYLSKEEILIANAGQQFTYYFCPASFRLLNKEGFNLGLI